MARRLLTPGLLFALALIVRMPTLSLPVDGEAAELASMAELIGDERGWVPAGTPPLVPLIAGAAVSTGVSPTLGLRWVDLLLGCLAAPLGWALARRLGAGRAASLATGLLLGLHPYLVANAGGVHPRFDGAGLALLLATVSALASARPGVRRVGAGLALLLALAHPAGPVYLLALGGLYVAQEPAPRIQMAGAFGVLLTLALGPVQPWGRLDLAAPAGPLLAWLPLVGLGVLWCFLPWGARRLLRPVDAEAAARPWAHRSAGVWLAAALLHVVLIAGFGFEGGAQASLDAPGVGALLAPLFVLFGFAGLEQVTAGRPRHARTVRVGRRVLAGACLGLSLFVATGTLQTTLFPASPSRAGRLVWMRDAVATAANAAGERGWIVLGVAEGEPATQASLADAHPGRAVCRRDPLPEEPEEDGLRVLLPFPARAYPADTTFAMVVPAPRAGDEAVLDRVTTFGGAAIFDQEPVARVGAYLVLRLRGTMALDQAAAADNPSAADRNP